ncbi:hypothetical protein HPY42_03705 [Coprothermobacteraceae bacterium]|nr:hypothetical protein [Coprothermobacteraceae bacterium]
MVDTQLLDRWVRLLDIYGAMLSDADRAVAELYLYYQLSLTEIAEQRKVSRQAVDKHLKNAIRRMEKLEERIGFLSFLDAVWASVDESTWQRIEKILEETRHV